MFSCTPQTKNKEEAIAKVGDKLLFRSQLNDFLPKNLTREDSILFADDYINKWIKQQLLINKANENLSQKQKDVEKELEDYRNSLIIYKYKNELIKQRMDTVVTEAQINSYFEKHKNEFYLDHSIVKAIFLKVPADAANPDLIKKLTYDNTNEGYETLQDYCSQYAKKMNISINEWINFEMIKKNIPEEITDDRKFLSKNETYEISDSAYYYFTRIIDYKLPGDLAPANFEKNRIKNLILNKRKILFLKDIEENIYNEGLRKNKFEIFDTDSI
jgi:hypothetical protein